ncbi:MULTISPECIES: peptidoglycan-binding protein [unclassified Streptomyces]|uniref:peptidoglycan-binding domain-containing protein n=1 Tax=unclassified Streptomyces TaxID=2593676 RepID=UPI00109E40E7|nr:peptidoglycan-binding domain-containing protein [Streptomyces sp. A1136]THA52981.1 peptidoglycan-binding protein [Streptomyces sp. A1136]
MPDDGLLVRPYVAAGDQPSAATAAPIWPHAAASAVRGPEPAPAPYASPAAAATRAPRVHRRGRRRTPPVLTLLAVLALAGAGGLVFLLSGPDPERTRAKAPPGLTVPVLPARSSDSEPVPSSAAPTRPKASASAPGAASPSASASPTASPGTRPGSSGPSVAPPTPAGESGTLRQGDKGPEVRELQQRLYGQGFTYVAVTGVYDGRTRRGVAQLQSDRGIKGDPPGVYGPATRAAFG